jgi:hypothetical protein
VQGSAEFDLLATTPRSAVHARPYWSDQKASALYQAIKSRDGLYQGPDAAKNKAMSDVMFTPNRPEICRGDL